MAKYYEKQSKSQNAASLGSTHLAFHNNLLSIKSEGLTVIVRIRVETSSGMKMSLLPSGLEW
jgi:hypothetical protein